MPIYEYECRACGRRTEVLQRASDPPLHECADCGGELRKLLSAPAFQFKGSGWYVTDYAAKRPSSAAGESGKGDEKSPPSSAGSDAAAAPGTGSGAKPASGGSSSGD